MQIYTLNWKLILMRNRTRFPKLVFGYELHLQQGALLNTKDACKGTAEVIKIGSLKKKKKTTTGEFTQIQNYRNNTRPIKLWKKLMPQKVWIREMMTWHQNQPFMWSRNKSFLLNAELGSDWRDLISSISLWRDVIFYFDRADFSVFFISCYSSCDHMKPLTT